MYHIMLKMNREILNVSYKEKKKLTGRQVILVAP